MAASPHYMRSAHRAGAPGHHRAAGWASASDRRSAAHTHPEPLEARVDEARAELAGHRLDSVPHVPEEARSAVMGCSAPGRCAAVVRPGRTHEHEAAAGPDHRQRHLDREAVADTPTTARRGSAGRHKGAEERGLGHATGGRHLDQR